VGCGCHFHRCLSHRVPPLCAPRACRPCVLRAALCASGALTGARDARGRTRGIPGFLECVRRWFARAGSFTGHIPYAATATTPTARMPTPSISSAPGHRCQWAGGPSARTAAHAWVTHRRALGRMVWMVWVGLWRLVLSKTWYNIV